MPAALPTSIDTTITLLRDAGYIPDRPLATATFLALELGRPLFLEGEAGVGKTEIAKVLSRAMGRDLVRLQCYEGLDLSSAVYEWNYQRQMLEIRMAEATGEASRETLGQDIFDRRFLINRPLLQALEPHAGGAPVLLIDELDRTDEPFEAFLLEALSDLYLRSESVLSSESAAALVPVRLVTDRTRFWAPPSISDILRNIGCPPGYGGGQAARRKAGP